MLPPVKYQKIIFSILTILIIFILWLIGYESTLNDNFSGAVQHVSYDEKHIPTVTIKGVEYQLGYNNWGNNGDSKDTIEIGDSMIKKKGQTFIKLIKRVKKDTVNFSHK